MSRKAKKTETEVEQPEEKEIQEGDAVPIKIDWTADCPIIGCEGSKSIEFLPDWKAKCTSCGTEFDIKRGYGGAKKGIIVHLGEVPKEEE